jgi:undecaprenyl-phosphate galactose phosphotransferase/putative colanic acid biosynthesis UDP-glucose lipid carrier transferase
MGQEFKAKSLVSVVDSTTELPSPPRKRRWVALPYNLIEGTVIAADFVLVVGTSLLAGIGYHTILGDFRGDIVAFLSIGALTFINFFAINAMRRNYKPQALADLWDQVQEVTATWFMVCFLLLAIAFSLKISDSYSRGATLSFFAAGWVALVCWRILLARSIARAFTDGGFAEQRIVILSEEGQSAAPGTIQELRRCGFRPVRSFEFRLDGPDTTALSSKSRLLLEDLIETCRRDHIDHVFLSLAWQRRHAIDEIMGVLRALSIPVHLLPDDNIVHFLGNRAITIGTTWATELKRAPLSPAEQFIKRTVDLTLATIGLVLLAPFLVLIAALIKLEGTGSVFFIQTRNGFNGETFGVRKFRTMRVAEDGPVIRQATRNDPRVTRLGRLLRRTNIDELPQLFNVITGDMSLVGPRPHAVAHNSEYQKLIGNYAFRYHVKPGITGWAQVNGLRGETQSVEVMARRVEFDLWYINNWSLWLDIKILFKTLVLGLQPNAY